MLQRRATDLPHPPRSQSGGRALWLLALFLVELAALTILYQFFARIECLATDAEAFCRGLRSLVARALSVAALLALLCWARPALARRLVQLGGARGRARGWMVLHILGLVLLLLPLLLAGGGDMAPDFAHFAGFWAAGALCASLGGLLWLMPVGSWRAVAGQDAGALLLTLAIAMVLPDLADLALPLWSHWPALTAATFKSSATLLQLTGLPVYVDAPGFILGLQTFAVHVANQCSGVEGMALVSGFILVYALLFRDTLRWGRYWPVVLPLGLASSWLLNVFRISALILIGEYVSPELAVNGFHSFAGTLFFTLLALGLMWGVQATPWLHRNRAEPEPGLSLRDDWLAARILPFILFMLLSSLVSAVFPDPEMGYPLKAIGMALAVSFFIPALRRQDWRVRLWPLVIGAAVGVAWLALADADPERSRALLEMLASYSSVAVAPWVALRLCGTILLVPLIEELFFRGYFLARLDGAYLPRRVLALTVSSLCFGLLHGRWVEGALSGVVFGLLYLYRGRVSDAVWAHVAANLVVALGALYWRDWSLI